MTFEHAKALITGQVAPTDRKLRCGRSEKEAIEELLDWQTWALQHGERMPDRSELIENMMEWDKFPTRLYDYHTDAPVVV